MTLTKAFALGTFPVCPRRCKAEPGDSCYARMPMPKIRRPEDMSIALNGLSRMH